jgi:hypothetical protein
MLRRGTKSREGEPPMTKFWIIGNTAVLSLIGLVH